MNVFNYNTLTKQLEINEPEILLVKEFKALLQRDKSVERIEQLENYHTFIQLLIGRVRIASTLNMKGTMKQLMILD